MDEAERARLEARLGRLHLVQRLGVEAHYASHAVGPGATWLHFENMRWLHATLRAALKAAGLYWRGRSNAARIAVRTNEIALGRLPPAFDGYTVLHVSDPHLDFPGRIAAALREAVAGLTFDLCALTGDYRGLTYGPHEATVAELARLRAALRGPVVAVLGNHDPLALLPAMEAMGIRVLMNESLRVERGGGALHVVGVDDPHAYQCDNLERAAEAVPPGACRILLAHSPELYRKAAFCGFDAMLCGHTHGGQCCLPGGIPLVRNTNAPWRLCSGPWRYRGLRGYTSRGAGVSGVDVRFHCPPEVVLHRLRRAPAAPPQPERFCCLRG